MAETETVEVVLAEIQADHATRVANGARLREGYENPCHICGKPMADAKLDQAWWVHMTTAGLLVEVALDEADVPDTQGWFPVGNDCARKVPATHRLRGLA